MTTKPALGPAGGGDPPAPVGQPDLAALREAERRILWLATALVQEGRLAGSQAASASMTSVMTALWLGLLEADDRVVVKPAATPVLHALAHLLGRTPPDRPQGIGATSAIWGALARRYATTHGAGTRAGGAMPDDGGSAPAGRARHVALLGEAELDSGTCWEALAEPKVPLLGELLWIVDLDRQSLDHVVPDVRAGRLRHAFEAAGWHAITLRYGRGLQALFQRTGGGDLCRRLDEMGNAEYERLLQADAHGLRAGLPGLGSGRRAIARLISELSDRELRAAIRDAGGHDLAALLDAYRAADAVRDRPSVIFAYTIRGRGLPLEAQPALHAARLTATQYARLARDLDADAEDPWAALPEDSATSDLCITAARRLERLPVAPAEPPFVPPEIRRGHSGTSSTQQAFGRFVAELASVAPDVAARLVTVSPGVAASAHLRGWIERAGIWSSGERDDWFANDRGQHVELGLAEDNLAGLLGALGATWRHDGAPLLPVGAIDDALVVHAQAPWAAGIATGGHSVLVGTGAHGSPLTPLVGLAQEGCIAWEPAFAQDLEWCLLDALARLGRADGSSAYVRLATQPLDQTLAAVPRDPAGRAARRADVLAGGYRLHVPALPAQVAIAAVGPVVADALTAARTLANEGGIAVEVVCLTSPDLVFRALQARQGLGDGDPATLARLFPRATASTPLPLVTVLDGHPHTLAFLAAATHGGQLACLGDTNDAETIVGAVLDVLD